jgi:hypothetical protein
MTSQCAARDACWRRGRERITRGYRLAPVAGPLCGLAGPRALSVFSFLFLYRTTGAKSRLYAGERAPLARVAYPGWRERITPGGARAGYPRARAASPGGGRPWRAGLWMSGEPVTPVREPVTPGREPSTPVRESFTPGTVPRGASQVPRFASRLPRVPCRGARANYPGRRYGCRGVESERSRAREPRPCPFSEASGPRPPPSARPRPDRR